MLQAAVDLHAAGDHRRRIQHQDAIVDAVGDEDAAVLGDRQTAGAVQRTGSDAAVALADPPVACIDVNQVESARTGNAELNGAAADVW